VASAESGAVTPAPFAAEPPGPPGSAPETITIHVAGAVTRPGLVVVPQESRIADVIVAAGGVTVYADLSLVNLAASVADGAQIIVPRFGSPTAPVVTGSVPESDALVRVNSADLDELMRLPGIGPVTARQIIEYRATHGPFDVVEDLLDVSGIGEGKLASLRDGVVVP
jgi:competence protein ComEA